MIINREDALYAVKLLGGTVNERKGNLVVDGLDETGIEIYECFLQDLIETKEVEGESEPWTPGEFELRVRLEEIRDNFGLGFEIAKHYDDAEKTFLIVPSWEERDLILKQYNFRYRRFNEEEWKDLEDIVDWGFDDEYSSCSDCGTAIRTSPDCYAWQPDFWLGDGEILCRDCTSKRPEDYLAAYVNQNKLVNEHVADPGKYGWESIDIRYENGWFHGQNADPRKIIEVLNKQGIDVLFTGNVGQFDVNFWAWVKEEKADEAKAILEWTNTNLPYDQATELGKALSGGGSEYIKTVTRTITPEEFVDGSWAKEPHEGVQITTIDYGKEE